MLSSTRLYSATVAELNFNMFRIIAKKKKKQNDAKPRQS